MTWRLRKGRSRGPDKLIREATLGFVEEQMQRAASSAFHAAGRPEFFQSVRPRIQTVYLMPVVRKTPDIIRVLVFLMLDDSNAYCFTLDMTAGAFANLDVLPPASVHELAAKYLLRAEHVPLPDWDLQAEVAKALRIRRSRED